MSLQHKCPHILVLGGRGFIGSHVVSHAVDQGWKVTFTGIGSGDTIPGKPAGRYLQLDTVNQKAVHAALSGISFDYVVNCGGYINHTALNSGGSRVLGEHFQAVVHLAEILERDTLKGFVNLGSSDEYGALPAPQRETMREAPISPYSAAKLAATHFLQMLWRSEEFPAITLRLFLVYGPGQGQARFLPQIIRSCLRGERFPTSAGKQRRDFCFIDDVVRAIFLALQTPNARGEVINVASGEPVAIRDVVSAVVDEVGAGEPDYGKFPLRTGENRDLFADITKATEILKWRPEIPFDVGLKRTIEFFRKKEQDASRS